MQIKLSWTDFKTVCDRIFYFNIQYIDDDNTYEIYVNDSFNQYVCYIDKTIPANSEQIDFETNYMNRVSSNFIIVNTIEHSRIHEGKHFYAYRNELGVGMGTNRDFLLITPNTSTRIHLFFDINSTKIFSYYLYEGTTVSANGTAMTALNNERNSANAASLLVYRAPTITTVGTELLSNNTNALRTFSRDEEFVLKQNTLYLLRLTSNDNNNNIFTELVWYEIP